MATFERELRVRAPFEDVWEFHSTIDGLQALTPRWANLRVEAVQYPEGSEGTCSPRAPASGCLFGRSGWDPVSAGCPASSSARRGTATPTSPT